MSGQSVPGGSARFVSIASLSMLFATACGGTPDASDTNDAVSSPTPPVTDANGADGMAGADVPMDTLSPAPEAMPPASVPPGDADQSGFIDDPNASEPTIEMPTLDEDTSCAGLELIPEEVVVEVPMDITTTTEVLQPVAFYIVLDNSSSMENVIPASTDVPADDPAAAGDPAAIAATGTTRWEVALTSLQAFVMAPESEGLDVALQYFNPPGQAGGGFGQEMDQAADDPLCNGSFHATPDVEMGRLPDNSQALVDSLTAAQTATGTPTVGALTGGIEYCAAFEAANPEENCVLVLVTDGLPSACGLEGGGNTTDAAATETLVQISTAGMAAGVETFTVGMDGVPPEGFTLLDAVAAAGGTDCTPPDPGGESCNVSTSGAEGLVATLNAIRDTVTVTETVTEVTTVIEKQKLECQWVIPAPPEDEMLDPRRVNVNLALDGAEPAIIPSVEDEAACEANGGVGWYYDDPDAPTTIFACTESCSQIQNGTNPVVNILLGCETVVVQVMR